MTKGDMYMGIFSNIKKMFKKEEDKNIVNSFTNIENVKENEKENK